MQRKDIQKLMLKITQYRKGSTRINTTSSQVYAFFQEKNLPKEEQKKLVADLSQKIRNKPSLYKKIYNPKLFSIQAMKDAQKILNRYHPKEDKQPHIAEDNPLPTNKKSLIADTPLEDKEDKKLENKVNILWNQFQKLSPENGLKLLQNEIMNGDFLATQSIDYGEAKYQAQHLAVTDGIPKRKGEQPIQPVISKGSWDYIYPPPKENKGNKPNIVYNAQFVQDAKKDFSKFVTLAHTVLHEHSHAFIRKTAPEFLKLSDIIKESATEMIAYYQQIKGIPGWPQESLVEYQFALKQIQNYWLKLSTYDPSSSVASVLNVNKDYFLNIYLDAKKRSEELDQMKKNEAPSNHRITKGKV